MHGKIMQQHLTRICFPSGLKQVSSPSPRSDSISNTMTYFRIADIHSRRSLKSRNGSKGLSIPRQDNAPCRILVVFCNKNNHWPLRGPAVRVFGNLGWNFSSTRDHSVENGRHENDKCRNGSEGIADKQYQLILGVECPTSRRQR